SLASVYRHVDAIVLVHSDVSWLGERGNTVRPLTLEWCRERDYESKVHHLAVSLTSQEAQYAARLEYIQKKNLGDIVMVIDADEIWEDHQLEAAKREMHDHPHPAYRCHMHTYLKTPFYRVEPPAGTPMVFFREPKYLTLSPRGRKAPARTLDA